jgi:hypothetical protein
LQAPPIKQNLFAFLLSISTDPRFLHSPNTSFVSRNGVI